MDALCRHYTGPYAKRAGPGQSFAPRSTSAFVSQRAEAIFSLLGTLPRLLPLAIPPKTAPQHKRTPMQPTQNDQEICLSLLICTMLPKVLPVEQWRARNRPLPLPGLLLSPSPRSPYSQNRSPQPHQHTDPPSLNMKCIVFAGLLASATAFIAPAPRVSVSVSLAGSEGGWGEGREGGRAGREGKSIKAHTYTHIHSPAP